MQHREELCAFYVWSLMSNSVRLKNLAFDFFMASFPFFAVSVL